MVETDRNRTGIPRLQGGCSPVELRSRMLLASKWTQAVLPRHLPGADRVPYWLSDGPENGWWSHGESHPDFEDAVLA